MSDPSRSFRSGLDERAIGATLGAAVRGVRVLLPTTADYRGVRQSWRADILAGFTVAIVALPLALAFGITTGLGAAAGLTTAIVAGFVAAVFGGSNVQVTGPTGAMAAVLVPIVHRHGPDAVILVGILAGVMVIAAAFLRWGRYLAFVPWPVIEGFTIGIATIILLQQLPNVLGVAAPAGATTIEVAIATINHAVTEGRPPAVGIALLVVGVMVAVARFGRWLPGSLVAVVVATVATGVLGLDVATIGEMPHTLEMPSLPGVGTAEVSELFSPALAIALLVALESLLSAKVADGMVDTGQHDPDRELFGQGLANVVAPLFGGMPATGAIARTAVNSRAGARTRVAAITHAVVLIGVLLIGGELVARIPLAALAGVLAVTAVRMVDPWNVRAIARSTRRDALVMWLTAGVTVLFDLILAVEVGIAVAAVLALRSVAQTAEVTPEIVGHERVDGDRETGLLADRILAYRLDGALFFGAAQRFLAEITAVSDVRVVILRLPGLQVLDATGARALSEIIEELESRGITVLIKGPRPEHLRVLRAVGALEKLADERHVFARLDEAVAHARTHVGRIQRPDPMPVSG